MDSYKTAVITLPPTLSTERLWVEPLGPADAPFIFELVNSPGWLQFIGDKQVNNLADAETYVQNICANDQLHYCVVKTQNALIAVGLVTLIKRDYLYEYDLGFAFLPEYNGQGYAFEACKAVIHSLTRQLKTLAAITLPDNSASIKLLKKLGFVYKNDLYNNQENLCVFTLQLES